MKTKVFTDSRFHDFYSQYDKHCVVLLIGRTEYRSECDSPQEAAKKATRLRSILRHQGIELVEE